MNDYVANISLDLNCQATPVVISAGQYDIGRQIKINLTADGETYDATGATAVCKGKSNNNYFAVNATVSKNIVTVTTDKAMLSSAGRTVAKIVLTDGTRTYSTQPFVINTHSDYDGDITTSDYYPELLDILSRVLALTESGAVLTDTNLSATSVNPLQNKVLTPIINTINNRLQSAEQSLRNKADATTTDNVLAQKEVLINKVSTSSQVTDSAKNYPSIKYLEENYWDSGNSYSSDEIDGFLGLKVDSKPLDERLTRMEINVNSKYDSANIESGSAELTVYSSLASKIKSGSCTYKTIGNTVIVNVKLVMYESTLGPTSNLSLTNMPYKNMGNIERVVGTSNKKGMFAGIVTASAWFQVFSLGTTTYSFEKDEELYFTVHYKIK